MDAESAGNCMKQRFETSLCSLLRLCIYLVAFLLLVLRAGANTVAAGANHTLAISPYGTVIAVGLNTSGQLGINSTTNQSVPVEISGLYGVVAVAAGELHSLALTSDGKVWSWGNNNTGQLGIGMTSAQQARSTVPVQVVGISERVIAISTQGQHNLALTDSGKVYAWGNNQYGQIGNNTSGTVVTTPVDITAWTGAGVTQIAAGANHNLAVRNGTVLAWGYNFYGQLGNNGSTNVLIPTAIASLTGVSKVAAGGNHSLALTASGAVYAWGYNAYYQLGDGTVTVRRTPQLLSSLSGIIDIAAGARHSAALNAFAWGTGMEYRVYTWGSALQGQLGTGATTAVTTPNMLLSNFDARSLAAGWYSTLYANVDGRARISGDNAYGQVGDATTTDRTSFVSGISPSKVTAAISTSALAMKPNGTLWG
jgi:alpha-tubulin suppressor-like RCC1 family protein